MGKKQKIILGVGTILFLIGIALYSFSCMGYMSEPDPLVAKPEKLIMAENLITYFKLHKNYDDSPFIGKVIGIEGVVKEINRLNNRHTILLKGGKNEASSIICDMQTNQIGGISKLKPGDTVFLKGIFKGFLEDVILLNCVIADKKTND